MSFKENICRKLSLAGTIIYENRSKIELTVGLIGSSVATVWIAKKATKIPEATENLVEEMRATEKAENVAKGVVDKGVATDMDLDILKTAKKTKKRIIKDYILICGKILGLPVALKLASDILIVIAFKTESDRASGALAAYNMLEASFAEYRARMKEELGDEREEEIYRGVRYEEVDRYDPETGETYKELEKKWGKGYSPWSCEFAKGKTPYWNDEFDYNVCLVTGRERFLEQTLRMKGVVTMVDVWDALGLLNTRTEDEIAAGIEWGWVRNKRYPDSHIDLGIKEFAAIPHPNENSPLNYAIPLNIQPMGNIKQLLKK